MHGLREDNHRHCAYIMLQLGRDSNGGHTLTQGPLKINKFICIFIFIHCSCLRNWQLWWLRCADEAVTHITHT